jgi:hypothetical protein
MAAMTTTPDLRAFTPHQRRRAEALVLVRALFPGSSAEVAYALSRWITEGVAITWR